ncbi:gamma-glutamyl-gamma-aminobutyrate hydrolase family protein [Lactococcus insecticola]|uniref:Glutamine amidotransferase n=1 Tax=Pseudolactococcus insecticola TaxID=2709158 RepID=A0A6A0B4I1_9LACT|nr:gamma-glutamyl-gamma-aminobutyrate hydrolase family protein [Lactococcus insecticola]GFH39936.1 glutamine amidotransferase [Lactococcus insecticola]
MTTLQPIIGVAANERRDAGGDMGHMAISYNPSGYIKAVQLIGGLPVMLPIGDPMNAKRYVSMIDKLVLAGGQNVAPEFYGEVETIKSNDYNRERDAFEIALINEAIKQNKPIIGVCRGMQLANVALGGSINQNTPNHWQKEASTTATHDVLIKKSTPLESIYGHKAHVNSFHRQSLKQIAPQLEIIAKSASDNVVEAVQSIDPNLRFIGVQWHPDFMYNVRDEDLEFFRYAVFNL